MKGSMVVADGGHPATGRQPAGQSGAELSPPIGAAEAIRALGHLPAEWLDYELDHSTHGLVVTDTQRHIVFANAAARQYLQLAESPVGRAIHQPASPAVGSVAGQTTPADDDRLERAIRGDVVRCERLVVRRTGESSHRTYLVSAYPLRDAAGTITGAVMLMKDEAPPATLSLPVEPTSAGVPSGSTILTAHLVVDCRGRICSANDAAAEAFGVRAERLTRVSLHAAPWRFVRSDGRALDPILQAVRTGRAQHELLLELLRPDGRRLWVRVGAVHVHDAHGHRNSCVVARVECALGRDVLQDAASEALSHVCRTLFHSGQDALTVLPDLLAVLQRERAVAAALYWQATATGLTCAHAHGELPLVGSSGQYLHRGEDVPGRVQDRETIVYGNPLAIDPLSPRLLLLRQAGVCASIGVPVLAGAALVGVLELLMTREDPLSPAVIAQLHTCAWQLGQCLVRSHAQQTLTRQVALQHALLDNASDLAAVVDEQGIVRHVTPAWQHHLGYQVELLIGTRVLQYVHPDDRGAIERALFEGMPLHHQFFARFRLRHARGTYIWVEIIAHDRRADPNVGGYVLNGRDISQRVELEYRLDRVEIAAPGSTVLSYDALCRRIRRDLAGEAHMAMLALHLGGLDEVVQHAGMRTMRRVRARAVERLRGVLDNTGQPLGMFGDTTFVTPCLASSSLSAVDLAERLGQVMSEPITHGRRAWTIKLSVGIVTGGPNSDDGHGQEVDNLVRQAYVAALSAAQTGTAYTVYSPAMHEPRAARRPRPEQR